jgi:hypothetical protein
MDNSNLKSKQKEGAYSRAKEKVQELKSFYFSLIFYVIVNLGLVYIWSEYSSHSVQWFWFPIIGWGIGLVFKAINAYELNVVFGKQWEQKQIQKYLGSENTLEQSQITNDNAYQNAKKKVDSIRGFYSHFAVYLVVNAFIVSTIVSTTRIDLLSFSALSTPIFWGIGLLAHGLGVFGSDFIFGQDWEDRKIKQLMDTEYNDIK